MPSSMVMEKNAMPNDMAKRGVATGRKHGSQAALQLLQPALAALNRDDVLRGQRSDGLGQDVVYQVARRLSFVQALQPVHAGAGFCYQGTAGGAALLVRLEGRQLGAVQRTVQGFGQKGLDLDALHHPGSPRCGAIWGPRLHSGLVLACHHPTCL